MRGEASGLKTGVGCGDDDGYIVILGFVASQT